MGFIREPDGVDFFVQNKQFTKVDKEELSRIIQRDKRKNELTKKGARKKKLISVKKKPSKKVKVRIDNSLKKYVKKPIFQDQLDKANEMLKVGLPKAKKAHR